MTLDIEAVRAEFPALSVTDAGRPPRIYFDNPAGTQAPRAVMRRIGDYFSRDCANRGGAFATSRATDALIEEASLAMAEFLGAAAPGEVVVGPSMSALTFTISRALERRLQPGDEIIVTRMDHDGNVSPWRLMAQRRGLVLKTFDFDRETYRYDLSKLDALVTPRTRLMAVNYASNITGTINDVAAIARRMRAAGALTYVDAVQFAPHGIVDVKALGCDFLVCSAYKFYGPHLALLWGRGELLEELQSDRLRVAPAGVPGRFEVGTQAHELIAGTLGALEYYAWLGGACDPRAAGRGAKMNAGKRAMQAHEAALARRLIDGLSALPGVTIHGLTGAEEMDERVSTVSLTVQGHSPEALARALGERNIFAWHGHNYAADLIEHLGLGEEGVLRLGPVHYNTPEEIDTVIEAMDELLHAGRRTGPRGRAVRRSSLTLWAVAPE